MTRLGQTLDDVRRRSLVGRDAELALFREALAGPGLIFVHGPGGVGKSALLDGFAGLAAAAGREPVRADARHLALAPEALPVPAGPRPVLILDTYELLEPIDDWVREQYLPSLPGGALVVLAGRRAPGPRWRADPAWRALTRVVELGNLAAGDARALLAAQHVAAPARERLVAISRGHPLTLSLLADAAGRGAEPRTLADVPDVVGALVGQLVEQAPSPRHRAALEACALVPATTEDYLRAMVGGDAGELFGWLRTLSFVRDSPYGLYPHDVVRDVLDADLRWRDPERYAETYARKLVAFRDQVRAMSDERAQLEVVVRMVVLNGARSRLDLLNALPPTMGAYADRLRPGDEAGVLAMAAGPDLVAYWLRRQPEAFHVFRTAGGQLCGYAACVELDGTDAGVDPVADAMWQHVLRQDPPLPGERVRAWRFFGDRERGQGPSPSMTLFVACQMLAIMKLRADVAWTLVGGLDDAESWAPTMEFLDFWPAGPGYAHDWRRTGVDRWTRQLHARHLGAPVRREPPVSRAEFADAVRAALRAPGRPDGRLEAGIAALDPAARELLTRTYLRPTMTQERLAVALHLSFNTYRRHRDRAVDQLVAWLWEHR
ncbi:ATP-binding protein [Actinoplanes sp. RD1]|uniref:ATP-binding protein n=1 Tax=Actinoplanes sp. RD1 TaxID=3064538 RepID=UPI002741169D|nr:ATP-binding protein [Actinoplanes sp. RD1]